MPFGVDLPDNLGETTTAAPESAPNSGADIVGDAAPKDLDISRTAEKSEAPKDYLDLDKLERFRFAGREWSPKELRNAHLRHEDYTRKTQETAEARKYADNFAHDIRAVIENPHRISEFRQVYPKSYVEAAQRILERMQGSGQTPQHSDPAKPNDPMMQKLSSLEEKFSALEAEKFKGEVEQTEAWLNSQFETLTKKYPYANSEVVTARAEVASRQGTEITKEVLDKLFKASDNEIKAQWEKRYKEKVQEQIKAGSKAKDTGTGGGIPGGAPKGFKTIKEATNQFIQDFTAKRQ